MQFILEEDKDSGYHTRTEINAKNADVIMAIAINFDSAGEKLTKSLAKKHGKFYIPISPIGDISEKAQKISQRLIETFSGKINAISINVTGNGVYTMKGTMTQEQCDDFTYNLLFLVVKNLHADSNLSIRLIRSGGQTGFDEAGIKAGLKLSIDTIAYYPKGYKIRDLDGDKTQTRQQVFQRISYKQKTKVFVDMDGVLCDFRSAYFRDRKKHPEIEFPQSRYAFFSNLEPIAGAIEGYKKLQEHFDMYILTRPSIYNLMCYTEKADWVQRHLGFHVLEKLIMMCDKSIVNGKGAFLIDDTLQAGQLDFDGQLIHFGSEKFPDWETVINFLVK